MLRPISHNLLPVSLTVNVTDNNDPAPVCLITDVTGNEATRNRLADHRSRHARSSRTAIWNGYRTHIHHYSHLQEQLATKLELERNCQSAA